MDWAEIYQRLSWDANDATAWDDLARLVRPWARNSLSRLGWTAVEDAIIDTCAAVALGLKRARGPETFGGFVYGHFLNCRKHLMRDPIAIPLETEAPNPSTESLNVDATEMLQSCLERLAERERRAVELRYLEDCNNKEIAAKLRISEGNARQLVFRGLVRLRACFDRSSEASEEA